MEAGDVLEFVSPLCCKTLLLRIYVFINVKKNNEVTDAIHAGYQPVIRVQFDWFEQEELEHLKAGFPPLTVIRKERPLTQDQWDRLKLDKEAAKMEGGKADETLYKEKVVALQDSIAEGALDRRHKTPRIGTEGCCGKGCNGCLIFWNDPSYAKARELMQSKKQGEMLSNEEDRNLKSGAV